MVLRRRCAWVSCLLSCLLFFASAGSPLRRRLLVSAPLPVCVCVAGFWSLGGRSGRPLRVSFSPPLVCVAWSTPSEYARRFGGGGGNRLGDSFAFLRACFRDGGAWCFFFWVFGGVLCSWCGFFGFWWVGGGFASLFSRGGVGASLGLLGGARSGALVVVQPLCFVSEEEGEGEAGGWRVCDQAGEARGAFFLLLGPRKGDAETMVFASWLERAEKGAVTPTPRRAPET